MHEDRATTQWLIVCTLIREYELVEPGQFDVHNLELIATGSNQLLFRADSDLHVVPTLNGTHSLDLAWCHINTQVKPLPETIAA